MMTLYSRNGSLAALALALAFALPGVPAVAQEQQARQGPFETRAQVRAERPPMRMEDRGGRAPARIERSGPPPASRPAPRTIEPRPFPQRAAAPERRAPDPGEMRSQAPRRGFGGEVADRVQRAERAQRLARPAGSDQTQPIERRNERRADTASRGAPFGADDVARRSEDRAGRVERRGRGGGAVQVDRRVDVIERPGDFRSDRIEDRSDRRADRIEDRGDRRVGRIEDRGDRRGDRIEDRAERRDGRFGERRDGRREEWRDGRGDNDRRDNWRDDRRGDDRRGDGRRGDWRGDWRGGQQGDDWRRSNWRRDDWRWNWNGRPGWDRRDFRAWDRGWRSNRSYNWIDFRRGNRFHYRPGPYFAPFSSHRYSRLQTGFFLDSLFFQPRFFINDPLSYRLPPVYGPYQWVRYYDDVLLVDIYTGEVVDVINDFFW